MRMHACAHVDTHAQAPSRLMPQPYYYELTYVRRARKLSMVGLTALFGHGTIEQVHAHAHVADFIVHGIVPTLRLTNVLPADFLAIDLIASRRTLRAFSRLFGLPSKRESVLTGFLKTT